jgi:CheY-like chemotaxis protein
VGSFKNIQGAPNMDKPILILIADPNPYVRSFLSRELGTQGFATLEAGTGKEILSQLYSGPIPDLLIMELDFPVNVGLMVLEKIQNLVPTVPQIIYTHFTEYENHPCVRKADDFVEKSEDPSDLLHSITQITGMPALKAIE